MRRAISTPSPISSIVLISILLIAGIGVQIISIPQFWSHRSDGEALLFGAYSSRYALVLAVSIVIGLFWIALAAFVWRNWRDRRARITRLARYAFLPAAIALFAPFLPFESHVKQWIATNGVLIALLGVVLRDSEELSAVGRWLNRALMVAIVLIVPLMILTTLTRQPYSPDEAHWADYASTAFVGTPPGVYARTWMMTPTPITPGIGWSVPAYGWLLENVAFDIRVGRLWNAAFYVLAFAAIGALAWRLYGQRAAVAAVGFAALSQNFIPILEYRPSQQMAFAGVLIALLAIYARQTTNRAVWWHGATGLVAAFSLQLHAVAIALIFGLGLYYAVEFIWALVRRQRIPLREIIAFGIGSGIGGAVYYAANIAPVGGLSAFLDILTRERGSRLAWFGFASWASLAEGVLIVISLIVLALRRTRADVHLLGMLGSFALALAILDTQGYRAPVAGLYAVVVGASLATIAPQRRTALIGWVFAFMLASAVAFVDWRGIAAWARTGSPPPFLYEALREPFRDQITDDDIIVGSHLLIWTFPDHPHLYSYAGETTAMRAWELPDSQSVWARIQPTVIIEITGQMHLTDSLTAEMDARGFIVCQQFDVLGVPITLYRIDCDQANIAADE